MGNLNVLSLILGLIGLILPFIFVKTKIGLIIRPLVSISASSFAVCLQLFYNVYLVNKEDWSALMDTADFVAVVSFVLIIITIMANISTLYKDYKYLNI